VYVYYGGCPDDDGDGICTSADCDDDDSSVGAPSTWYADTDSDGYGDPGTSTSDCSQPSGYVSDGQDCDDTDGDTWPGAAASDSTTDCMTDADGDGYGDDDPATEVTAGTDCDDGDASISPAAAEAPGDAVDQDCDDAELCYADNDDDGYTDGTTVASGDTDCDDAGEGTVAAGGGDCDDDDARTWPGAADLDSTTACMTDGDGDGYGDDSPVSGVAPGTDCDDGDAAVSPQATELVDDGLDQDCDTREACYADADGDGFTDGSAVISDDLDCVDAGEAGAGAEDGDCDDTDAQTWPGAAPSDSATACMTDADGDGYGDGEPASGVTAGTDCDDEDSAVSPSAVEVAGDLFDQDCDGTELCTADGDDDGYLGEGTTESTNIACDGEGEGTASDPDGDCDDTDGTVHPGAEEVAGDGVDQDCDGEDLPKRDVPEEDCGCTGAPDGPGSAWWVALVALVGLRRRAALRGR
jgi:hypothetical protein